MKIYTQRKTNYGLTSQQCESMLNIYHSDTPDLMQIKLANYGYQLNDSKVKFLVDCLVYHASFWPHTLPRYKSFLSLVKRDKLLRKSVCTDSIVCHCMDMMRPCNQFASEEGDDADFHFSTLSPGQKWMSYYYADILKTIVKLMTGPVPQVISNDKNLQQKRKLLCIAH